MSKPQMIQTDLDSVLTAQEIAEIDAELGHVPYKSGAAIDALKIVQAKRGWVSDECLQAIARRLEMSAEELEGVATFYNLIYRRPVGEKVILVLRQRQLLDLWLRRYQRKNFCGAGCGLRRDHGR
jgi:NADH-quinone oxidoreductase subunit E